MIVRILGEGQFDVAASTSTSGSPLPTRNA
jgi:hypothetical protein